ncbi:MAG: hypothetical protein J6W75_13590 [Bacteroidaceae bacterium]|nr:hypothetical protein [Bacteroidaceae bacterium]
MRLLFFNPWNDLALASNDPHYTPPASARQMAMDLADLPSLWAKEDDLILHPGEDQSHIREMSSSQQIYATPFPWGWSPLAVTCLREAGVLVSDLPTAEQLEAYRVCSSRQTAVHLLARLRQSWSDAFLPDGPLIGESTWCQNVDDALAAIAAYGGTAILKAPWSGSGRGVRKIMATHSHSLSNSGVSAVDHSWLCRTLNRQGGVEVEPFYDKELDFAMEFWVEGGRVGYEGLSIFTTTDSGVYSGNLVATEEEKLQRLARYVHPALLCELSSRFAQLLSTANLPAWYTGPLGVDMMVVHTSSFNLHSSFLIHPLVELNFRTTMGWVACQLTRKLKEGETAIFKIDTSGGHYKAVFEKNEG